MRRLALLISRANMSDGKKLQPPASGVTGVTKMNLRSASALRRTPGRESPKPIPIQTVLIKSKLGEERTYHDKATILPLAAILVLAAGATTAKAVEFDVGPGGVYVGPHRHDYRYRDYDAYDRYDRGSCRVVIERRTNRFGEDVTVRRRVCD
jgi:hypothetical protein